jgi:PAS domain S-box-containing protein
MIPSDEVLRGLLEAAPDALIVVDVEGRIVYANQQTETLFGWDREELLGRPVEELVPARFTAGHPELRAGYVAAPTTRPMGAGAELGALRRDGSEFPAGISLSAIDTPDGLLVAAAVRDVSQTKSELQRQAAEAQREQGHRLAGIGQLAGGIAHDFNNLLGVILNYATLAERAVEDPAVADDIAQIRTAAERAADLTRQLLAFARRDTSRPEALVIDDLVDRFAQMLERTLGEHIDLRVHSEDAPLVVMADRHQVEQVLLNLCLNGRDAMPDGGVLEIATGRVDVDPQRSGDLGVLPGLHAHIEVADHGEGMPQTVIDRAFEPFFTTKGPGEGTGLGLATVYGIVGQSGGAVALESEQGAGTRVHVYLPLSSTTPAPTDAVGPSVRGGAERILLVEDEDTLRVVTARMLREHGYEVVTACDGLDAIEVYDRLDTDVDLVLTDVVMPRASGPNFVQDLRGRDRWKGKVLFMSGYAATSSNLQEDRILGKPFTEEALLAAVREVLDVRG